MKQSNEIISHIQNRSFRQNIKRIKCFKKILSLLPPKLSRAVLFMYIKNRVLFFALNHPGFKMEFNYNVNLIKELLKKLKKMDLNCKELDISDIKVFVSDKEKDKKNINHFDSDIYYTERATGDFEIYSDNEKLQNIFKNIQKIIKNNNHTENVKSSSSIKAK